MSDRATSAPADQDGEFELTLDNKRLFSLLFIVFVLLGVFFAMGYVMGRNSGPLEVAGQRTSEGTPATPRPSAAGERAAESIATPTAPVASAPAEATRETRTPEPSLIAVVEPKPGQTFLQVSAVARPEAELLVEVLTKKNFKAVVAPGPTDKLFRVLVGPSVDDTELGKTRSELERAGFKPIPRRY